MRHTMTLAEAIRAGMKLTPKGQAFGNLITRSGDGTTVLKACAIGTAWLGLGFGRRGERWDQPHFLNHVTFPGGFARCPKCGARPVTGGGSGWVDIVVHLNDQHVMSREDICAWLDREAARPPRPRPSWQEGAVVMPAAA